MTSHARAEGLLAAAIDFNLTPAEHTEMADHLAICPDCRALAAGYRSDTASLRAIAYADPPAHVWTTVIRSASGPPSRAIEPWKLLVAAALLLTALLGATAAIGAWNSRPSLVVVPPIASPSGETAEVPSAGPSTVPIVALDPTTAQWTQIGSADASGPLVGSDGGYAMLTSGPEWAFGDVTTVAFSTDGQQWDSTNLANPVTNCPDWGPPGDEQVADAVARAIATNGHEFMVVGEEVPHDAAGCANVAASVRPIAWYSPDGRTWQRSAPFEVGGQNLRATAVWATPTGWQAAVEGSPSSIWESVDGLAWHLVAELSSTLPVSVGTGSALDGTLVFADPEARGLTSSPDGRTWAAVSSVEDCNATEGATQVVGPKAQGLDAWVVAFDMRILCSSHDLVSWSGTTMTGGLSVVGQTGYGAIAVGDACFGAGVTCAPDPWAYLSSDGVTWVRMPHPPIYWGRVIADGPAGVLLVGQGVDGDATTVWRLDPAPSPTAVEPSSEPTPFAPPVAECPSPLKAVALPAVTVSVGDGPAIAATQGSTTTLTCTTTGSADAVPIDPAKGVSAGPGDLLTLALPSGWRFLHWEGSDRPVVGEGANVWPPTDTPQRPRQIEVPVPVRSGDSIAGYDLWIVSDDGRVIGQMAILVRVSVSATASPMASPAPTGR